MSEIEKRNILSKVALGNIPPDTIITNGILFDVFTREFIKRQSIWIKDGMIAYVGSDHDPAQDEKTEVIDADSMVLLPGLIDGQIHPLSHRSGIEEFIKHVIPCGVTTVVTEMIEYATIAGKDGIEYAAKGLEGQPIRFYYTLPPLCGLTLSEEGTTPSNKELFPFLKDQKCLGVGDIHRGNISLEGKPGERVMELVSMALGMGKVVEGVTAGASGRELQAVTGFDVSSFHEPMTENIVLQKLRLGYRVMIREGSIRKELEGVKGIFRKRIDLRRLILATDGVDSEDFLTDGYLDASLRSTLKLGVSPKLAYQMVTINVAEHFHLDHLIGSLSPGRMADILTIPSPDDFSPQWVMCDGKIIHRDGKSFVEPRKVFFPDYMFNTVRVRDFTPPSLPKRGYIRAMELMTRFVTKENIIDLESPEESKDAIMILALDRLGSERAFMGLLKNFGLERGAYGTTMTWDMTDLIAVGCDSLSMETVIGRLKEIGGGGVYAIGKEVVAEFPAPLCGIICLKPMEMVREEVRKLEESLRENGVNWEKPTLTVDTLGTLTLPHLRITHQGYVNVKDRKILPVGV